MEERTAEATTTVEENGIRVDKSFTDDAFPVPAVLFELSSRREDAVRVRVVDRIPDSFPMDRIGFHPEYESENWTAYKDHRVEFERVLEPGESVDTVFGIRDDDPDLETFLGDPVVEHAPVGEEIGDVLGIDGSDAVREVLSGDRATLPGMEGERPAGSAPASTDSEPRSIDDGTTTVVTPRVESGATESGETESGEDESGDGDGVEDDGSGDDGTGDDGTGNDGTGDDGLGAEPTTQPSDGIAAALADEIRSGEVDEADLELLRSELDVGVPRSLDVRIERLQASVADIEAYADALAEFIDEEGTAPEVLDRVDSRVDDVETDVNAVEERVDAGESAREDLAGTVNDVEDAVDDLGDDVETLYEEVDAAAAGVERTEDRVDDVDDRLERFEAEFDDLGDDLAEVDARLSDIEDRFGDEIEDVDAELAEITEHLEEIEAFRNRVNEAFSP